MPRNKFTPHLLPIGLFLLLSVLMTWPLVAHITEAYPTVDKWYGGDPNMYIWYIDWMAKALTGAHPVPAGQMIFWPVGMNPFAGYDGLLMHLIGLPAVLLSGNPILAYNLIILSCIFGASLTAYLLGWKLLHDRLAATVIGLLYAFSPYLLVRTMQHPNLSLILIIPLVVLATINFGRDPNRKTGLLLFLVILLNGLTSNYYAIGAAIFVLIAFIYYWGNLLKKRAVMFWGLIGVFLGTLLPALPALIFKTAVSDTTNLDFIRNNSTNPLNFFLPHPETVYGQITGPIAEAFIRPAFWGSYNLIELTSYFGLPLLILIIIAWRWRHGERLPDFGLWVATLFTFTILSMGPDLTMFGLRIPLPMAALQKIFPFSLIRSPNRLFIFALLAGVFLASVAVVALYRRTKTKHFILGAILLGTLILSERMMLPYPMLKPDIPEFYRQLATEQEVYALADLPITYPGVSEYGLYQTIHGKPIVNTEFFFPAMTEEAFSFIRDNGLLAASVCKEDPDRIMAMTKNRDLIINELKEANVRYVIIHHFILNNTPICEYSKEYLRRFFKDKTPEHVDGMITVYRL
jgi:hypothetical protein